MAGSAPRSGSRQDSASNVFERVGARAGPSPRGSIDTMKRTLLALVLLAAIAPAARAQTTDALLDSIQASSFRFFWYEATPNGLIRDRSQPGSPCSIASLGFGLS